MNMKKNTVAGIAAAIIIFTIPLLLRHDFESEYPKYNHVAPGEGAVAVHFIDVGQGDCILAELPEGKTMLIDAGDNGHENEIIDYIDSLDIDRIDYLLATHPHADHIGGMEEIIEEYDVGTLYMPRAEADSKSFEAMLRAADEESVPTEFAEAGKTIFDYSSVRAEILHPYETAEYDGLNNYSAVVSLSCGETDFLFMGDAEKEVEYELLSGGEELGCDILKLAHHGSSTSSSMEFLEAASPEYTVISCGEDNKYRHPHKEILNRLKKIKTKVLRTDKTGTIIITADSNGVTIAR